MLVFDIVIPGTWLNYDSTAAACAAAAFAVDYDGNAHVAPEFADYGDDAAAAQAAHAAARAIESWVSKTEGQLRSLQSKFFEANLALNLFNSAQCQSITAADHRDRLLRAMERRREIREAVEQERGRHTSREDWEQVSLEVEIQFNREQWASGQLPMVFEHSIPHLYARSFIFALDGFDRHLEALAKTDGVPAELVKIHERVGLEFPHLRNVRNTAHHTEKRGLSLDRKWKPIKLKPVDNGFAKVQGGTTILDGLHGSRYGATMENGRYGSVDVSAASMEKLRAILLDVLHSFPWKGPKEHAPK
ncbi:hypothetical protein [Pseudomonas putida]|uniref:hypothetical protein n=1 Tax=Pseudomonas putida TaxID=303 RepID=UPI00384C2629